jgi:Copper transport outer membrane protein, MctB
MGYSARYHAYSLIAVFIALGVGIVIGAGFGQDLVSSTSRSLEESLQGDLEDARAEADELAAELAREREFSEAIYPALVEGRLVGDRVQVIALGSLPDDLSDDIETALEPTGATLAEVAVVRQPPDLEGLAEGLDGTPFERLDRDADQLEAFGRAAGRQLVQGGGLIDDVREQFLSRASGEAERASDVILVRDPLEEASDAELSATERLEAGLLQGIAEAGVPVGAVERSDTEPTSVPSFDEADVPTVDSVDLVSGRAAMVFVLLGAEGNFGIKETADQLLPDLLAPAPGRGQ